MTTNTPQSVSAAKTFQSDITYTGEVNLTNADVVGLSDQRPYKIYVALLTQGGSAAPIAVELENTFDDAPIWTREDVGVYRCNHPDIHFFNCTAQLSNVTKNTPGPFATITTYVRSEIDYVEIMIYANGVLTDSILDKNFFELKVYP
jgi:hypothetical protein